MSSYNTYEDRDLLALLRGGDEEAFTVIYNRYWDKLLYIVGKKLDDLDMAENIVQEVFMDIWHRRASLDVQTALDGYLVVAVKYRIINYYAKQSRDRAYQLKIVDDNATGEYSTENMVSFDELKEWLMTNVSKLPEKCRIVYSLREEGCSQKEIARRMNISEKTVENHVGRALKILRTKLDRLLSFF